jgi:molybdate transport system ATP-binding protein
MLRARIAERRGDFSLAVELSAAAGEPLVLVGPNGAGKSTVLRVLAGVERPDEAAIAVDGDIWADPATGTWCPPDRRRVGWVPQELGLFPHLDAVENVAFGLRARGVNRNAGVRARALLAELGIEREADRRPAGLSGGERQRVALARALVAEPRLLLLDEPLSAVDAAARPGIRALVRRILAERDVIALYVTHSPLEALAIGGRLAVMESGRIVQNGAPGELLRHPRSEVVGAFAGTNFFRGRVAGRDDSGLVRIETGRGALLAPDGGLEGEVCLAIDPREIVVSREPPEGSARNVLRGRVLELAPEPPDGGRVRVALATEPPLVAEVTRVAVDSLGLADGMEVYASFKATALAAYR